MGTEHPVDEIRALCGPGHDALCLPEAEELILGRNAERLLGLGAA
jgi:predicted TIM-barrel fold metal-dependent hydrolase